MSEENKKEETPTPEEQLTADDLTGVVGGGKTSEKPVEYLKIKLQDILITSVSPSGSSGESQ
jgi:hypothetical protein